MPQLTYQSRVSTGQSNLDFGIVDVMVHEVSGGVVLYSTSGVRGGVVAYDVAAGGSLSVSGTEEFHPIWDQDALSELALVEVDGQMSLAVAGSGDFQVRLYDLAADGALGAATRLLDLPSQMGRLAVLDQVGGQALYMTDQGGSIIRSFEVGANDRLVPKGTVADTASSYAADVNAIGGINAWGKEFVVSVSATERGVSTFQVQGLALVNTGNAGQAEGVGIMTPTASAFLEHQDRGFVVVASAPSVSGANAGAITVLEIAQNGALVPVDHVIDNADTRFGTVQSLEVVREGDHLFIVAAGGDDGISVFAMLPNGRLSHLASYADPGDQGLANVSALTAHASQNTLNIFAASEVEAGLAHLAMPIVPLGRVEERTTSLGPLQGTNGQDFLVGGVFDDSISGAGGDDILQDGYGRDTLVGGTGSDTLILDQDFFRDFIMGFEVGLDKIDLSSWPLLYDFNEVGFSSTSYGAELRWRGDVLEIHTQNGQSLSRAQVEAALAVTPDRSPDVTFYNGNGASQVIEGSALNDAYQAGSGADTVRTYLGDDLIYGGFGDDSIFAGAGDDTIRAGPGNDFIDAGLGQDLALGASGNDTLIGSAQNDTLHGEEGRDFIEARDGNDVLTGGLGFDTLDGGHDQDLILGEDGNDLLYGRLGYDTLNGGAGADSLFGGNNEDHLDGGSENDLVRGGAGHDTIFGGAGQDSLFGDIGDDRIFAGQGNDVVETGAGQNAAFGSGGNDTLRGGNQNDTLHGEDGNDHLDGVNGNDRAFGGDGNDSIEGRLGADFLVGGNGKDTVLGGEGHDTVDGGSNNDIVFGGGGNDLVVGGSGADQVNGGNGNDTLRGGPGSDTLSGGQGADIFEFHPQFGQEVITDFDALNPGEKMDLSEVSAVNALADVLGPNGVARQVGADVHFDLSSGQSIILLNVALADLDASDFLF